MYAPRNTRGKLEWFNGNFDALAMTRYIIDMVDIWDDVVDKDNVVSEKDINYAFTVALVILPANPFYRAYQHQFSPLWTSVIMNYCAANAFERSGEEKKLHIAYSLKISVINIIALAITFLWGVENAAPYIEELWAQASSEPLEDYIREHKNEDI